MRLDGELYKSEGSDVSVENLIWTKVKKNWSNGELRSFDMHFTWDLGLTEEKGGLPGNVW